ncbi:MAG: hypothetical protein HYZ11_17570 [Candidatus Tectomicrobia bacterium]|uniref:FecR protein domain-containing protein n=1 Tax=Tectimicrobiota bacterium TaxID=2528274 RepID=A0A932I153_UNCTE|nr:hypothetical protein [Candidatus Tectomicrobia bacterium]
MPGGGWVETGPQDRVLIWLQSQPGCQFLLEPESRLVLHPGRRADAPEYVVAKLERGVLRVPSEGCRTALEVTTSVGRLLSHGARFSVKATDGWISVFHQAGNLQLIFQDQTVPLRTSTVTTISSTGSHRITSFTEADKEPAPANLLPRRPSRGESPAVPNVSPVSASGRP